MGSYGSGAASRGMPVMQPNAGPPAAANPQGVPQGIVPPQPSATPLTKLPDTSDIKQVKFQ